MAESVEQPKGDPSAVGPYREWIDNEAEAARREALAETRLGHRMAHEFRPSLDELQRIAREEHVGQFAALVRAFYVGRESLMREGHTAEQTRRDAVNSLHRRMSAALANATNAELSHGGEG